ncbi:uncharacterized protein LOC111879288 [Lactuca sativa]|nr:uncharacterized protein LOC111879288 [Lactuca sativa]
MIVSKQALYASHHHLSTHIRGGGGSSSIKLRHLSSGKTRRKVCRGSHIDYSKTITTTAHSFKFLNPNLNSSGGRNSTGSVCKNAMNGTINGGINAEEVVLYEEGGRVRKVKCEVEVISWRERRVKSEVQVDADVDSVWNALTDYERLADFIPNLIFSARIPCMHPGRIWLEQRGLQRALYWHIEARVVLDLQEFPNSANGHELHFSMVDGDFKKFEGKWCIKPGKRSSNAILSYEVNVIPNFNLPAIFMERIIRSDLPVNLQALARRSERNFEGNENITTKFHSGSGSSSSSTTIDIDGTIDKNTPTVDVKENDPSSSFSPLSKPSAEVNNNWGVFGKTCDINSPCKVDEIHLRRFDGLLEDGGVHRCVVASITVKAPVREVWNVLTSYETLPEIVPNLAISKILARENNKVRILQEGCKGLLYMVLHARVVLDLCEHLEQEITFEQVEGDFDSFKGRWLLEQLGNHHTLLKYNVESKMHQGSLLSEAIMEEVIYEDLPSNLCAIRDYIEKKQTENSIRSIVMHTNDLVSNEHPSKRNDKNPSRQRNRVVGLHKDIEVLKSELLKFISEHGQEGFMPMRSQLRKHGRFDMEKAISRRGGFRKFASLMNLSLAYKDPKPKGYWDQLENLKEEISRFQKSWGMDPTFMPSRKSFERGGRYDIARALEKWGGLHEVSRLLSLKVRHPNRMRSIVNDGDKSSSKHDVSQDTQKWLEKLKDLDINWVE